MDDRMLPHQDPGNHLTSPKWFHSEYNGMTNTNLIRLAFSFILASSYIIAVSLVSPNIVKILYDQMVDGPLTNQDYVTIYLITTILFLMACSFAVLVWYDRVMKNFSIDYSG